MHLVRTILKHLVLAALAVTTFSACSDATAPSIYGTYYLQNIDGYTVPLILDQATGYRYQLYSGTITLRSNGTFTDVLTYQTTEFGTTTEDVYTSEGAFVKTDDSEVIMTYEGGGTIIAQLQGKKLKQTIDDLTWVYEK